MTRCNPFSIFLVEQWRKSIFQPQIFPGFPLKPGGWKALAFNRDRQGNTRLPEGVWRRLIDEIRRTYREEFAFVASPDPLTGGVVMEVEQPFVVRLNLDEVLAHFLRSDRYLPEFFMAGVGQKWAVWGDSDLTVVGGESSLLLSVMKEFGGEMGSVMAMTSDFGLDDSSANLPMLRYVNDLVAGTVSDG
ncbi:hypothetical protein ACYX7E_14780 [Luteimonas sp. RIT-PG2_3]